MQETLATQQGEPFDGEPSLRFFHYQGLEEGTLEYQEALDIESMIQGGIDIISQFRKYSARIKALSRDPKYKGVKSIQALRQYDEMSVAYRDLGVLLEAYFGDSPSDYLRSRIDENYRSVSGSYRDSRYFANMNEDSEVFTHIVEIEGHAMFRKEWFNKMTPPRLRYRVERIKKDRGRFTSIDFAEIRMDIDYLYANNILVYDLGYDYGNSRDNHVGIFFSDISDILISYYNGDIDIDVSDFVTGIFENQIKMAEGITGFKFSENPIAILNHIKNNSKYHISTDKSYPLQSGSAYRILFKHMKDVESRVISERQRLHIEEERSKIKRDSKYSKPRRPQWDDDE
ncbi:MAG: hypothetical protein ACYDBX_02725 [Patescibacteria group bacterium]